MLIFQKAFFYVLLVSSLQTLGLYASGIAGREEGDPGGVVSKAVGVAAIARGESYEGTLTLEQWYGDVDKAAAGSSSFEGVAQFFADADETDKKQVVVCIAVTGGGSCSGGSFGHTAMFCASWDAEVRIEKVHARDYYAAEFLRRVGNACGEGAPGGKIPSDLARCYNWIGTPEMRHWPDADVTLWKKLWPQYSHSCLTFREIRDRLEILGSEVKKAKEILLKERCESLKQTIPALEELEKIYTYIVRNFEEKDFKSELCVSWPDRVTKIRSENKYTFIPSTMFLTSREKFDEMKKTITDSIAKFGDPAHTLELEGKKYELYSGVFAGHNCDDFVSAIWTGIESKEIVDRITGHWTRVPCLRLTKCSCVGCAASVADSSCVVADSSWSLWNNLLCLLSWRSRTA